MQLRSEALRLGRWPASSRRAARSSAALDPLLEQARAIAQLNDPRGLYAYCWCKEPPGARRVLVGR